MQAHVTGFCAFIRPNLKHGNNTAATNNFPFLSPCKVSDTPRCLRCPMLLCVVKLKVNHSQWKALGLPFLFTAIHSRMMSMLSALRFLNRGAEE